jgi:hypothetical protein
VVAGYRQWQREQLQGRLVEQLKQLEQLEQLEQLKHDPR